MASVRTGTRRRRGRWAWREATRRLWRRLFCCSCLACEEQEMKMNGGPQRPHLDQWRSGETEAIQITVEDLGIVNANFSLLDEAPRTPQGGVARSVSSVSICPRALRKTGLKRLSSLPIQRLTEPGIRSASGEDDAEEEEDPLLYGNAADGTPASGSLLTPPAINLIPPTPSDLADDDQFFDVISEESGAQTSGDQEAYKSKPESVEAEESNEGVAAAENEPRAESAAELDEGPEDRVQEETEVAANKDKTKPGFLRSAYQVAPLPECPQRRSFNAGINLLSFTEHNLDDLSNCDVSCSDMLKAELCLLPANMDTPADQRRRLSRSCSLGATLTRSTTFHDFTGSTGRHQEEAESRRRTTIASFMPQSEDQDGNFPEKDVERPVAKCLKELNTDEVCQWFTNIGLQKCLPSIKEAKLRGADIASVGVDTLDILQVTSVEDREHLLSAIYNELHPPSTNTQRLDSLLGQNDTETFAATLASMSKSMSAPHVSCLSTNRRSLKLRINSQNCVVQRNSQLIEITINASERIVHLRTPKETTVGKIMDSCIKMLGLTEDKRLFALREKQGSPEELSPEQQIGSLVSSTSENSQLELHLCKTGNPSTPATKNSPEVNGSSGNADVNVQENQPGKEERIRELNQQVDSLQNVIFQVQELHHGLVAFCSELKNMDGDVDVDRLGSAELKQRLESAKSRVNDKRQSLQNLRDNMNNSADHKKKQSEVRLLEKMKLNCQVFKEEISMVHLNRQVAHLQKALQDIKEKARKNNAAIGSLSQLVSPRSPAMLVVVQENRGPDGRYGFACSYREDSGLVVVEVDDTHLCIDDRVVEVNGVPVVNFTEEDLTDLLQQGPSAELVVLRQAARPPSCQQRLVDPDPMRAVTMETPPRRKVITI